MDTLFWTGLVVGIGICMFVYFVILPKIGDGSYGPKVGKAKPKPRPKKK